LIKVSQPIIVEGKYDKITLENAVEGLIIPTDGFSLFKNKEKCGLIRTLAQKYGVIVVTDSDSAGNMIRAYIKKIAGDCEIINVYIPQLKGKEKRKSKESKEGFLGVEGMSRETLIAAFEKSGITGEQTSRKVSKITKLHLFERGLSGTPDSSKRRVELLEKLELPVNLSPNAMLDILNTIMTLEEFCEVTDCWLKEQTKN